MSETPDGTDVRHVAEANRYEITVAGEQAGLVAYVDHGDQRIFVHTEIDDKFGGRGLAAVLVSAALTDARAAGKRIVAVCPYVAKYVKTHHDFDDVLDPVTPDVLAVVEANEE